MNGNNSCDFSNFKKTAIRDPKGIFEKIRNHGSIELAYFSILFSELESEWNEKKVTSITIKKIICLTKLFLSTDYSLELNFKPSDLQNDKYFYQVLALDSEKKRYILNQNAFIDNQFIQRTVLVFNDMLMYFYRESLSKLYNGYLSKAKRYSLDLYESDVSNYDYSIFQNPPLTPRDCNTANSLTPRSHEKIFDELNIAGFNIEKYALEEFKRFYIIANNSDHMDTRRSCLPFCRVS